MTSRAPGDRRRSGRHVRERRAAGLWVVSVVAVLAACGGGGERPSDAQWRDTWRRNRELIPDAATIISGGADFCGELLGELRVSLPELEPTPTEALDDPVTDWIAHAESIAFECPDDPSELSDRLRTLDLFAAEIEAGLDADTEG